MTSTQAAVSDEALASISTPDRVESRLGTLEFDDGAPSKATAALLYENLDFQHGVQAFLGALPRSLDRRRASRFPVGRRRGQLVPVVLRPDGFRVIVPDRQL